MIYKEEADFQEKFFLHKLSAKNRFLLPSFLGDILWRILITSFKKLFIFVQAKDS